MDGRFWVAQRFSAAIDPLDMIGALAPERKRMRIALPEKMPQGTTQPQPEGGGTY